MVGVPCLLRPAHQSPAPCPGLAHVPRDPNRPESGGRSGPGGEGWGCTRSGDSCEGDSGDSSGLSAGGGLVSPANRQLDGNTRRGHSRGELGSLGSRAHSCAELSPRGIPAKPHWSALGRAAGPGCGEDLVGSTGPLLWTGRWTGSRSRGACLGGEVGPSLPGRVILCRGSPELRLTPCRAHSCLPPRRRERVCHWQWGL